MSLAGPPRLSRRDAVLANPAVTCVIPATSKVRHVEDNMAAAAGPLPDEELRRRMAEAIALA